MPGKRDLPSNLTLHVVDIIIVSVLLLISHVHVHDARPPSEHNFANTRLPDSRGLHNTRRLGANNNNHHGASQTSMTHDTLNRDVDRTPMILPSSKDETVDGSLFTGEGEGSGDSSLDDHESNDDNEEGDEDDYDGDERGEDIDPGSGNHEPKDTIQSTFPRNSQTTSIPVVEQMSFEDIITKSTPTPTSPNMNEPATTKHDYYLPTTIKPELVSSNKVIPPTTQQDFTPSSIFTSATEPQHFPDDTTEITTKRPLSSEATTKLPDSSSALLDSPKSNNAGSRVVTIPSDDIEEEDEEDEDEDNDDDEDDSSPDFVDNQPSEPESNADKPSIHISTVTTETHPTLETTYTQAPSTTFKPSTITTAPVEITSIKPILSTAATTTTTTTRPYDTDNSYFTHTTNTAPIDEETDDIDKDGRTDIVDDDDDDNDDDDYDDDDLDDTDDSDDLDDIDSDISDLDPNIHDSKDKKYSENTVDIKNNTSSANPLDDSTTLTPNDLKLDSSNTRGPSVITDNRVEHIDEPHTVQETYYPNLVSRPRIFELRSLPLFAHPVIILCKYSCHISGSIKTITTFLSFYMYTNYAINFYHHFFLL